MVTADVHFVQAGDAPILIGSGKDALSCECGNRLIDGYAPAQFLGVGVQCGRCGTVTTTPPLATGAMPPSAVIAAEASTEPRASAMTVPAGVAVVGRAEKDRLSALLRPVTPADSTYRISPALLDDAASAFERHTGGPLPVVEARQADRFAGLRDHALAWAVQRLRDRMREGSWACMEDAPTANAVTHVAGFLHFVSTWSHHPLFPAMVATAGDRGFSLHGLARFAAAHVMVMMGNRISFAAPTGYPGRIEGFEVASSGSGGVAVHVEVFDRFEFPFGRVWDPAGLRAAVSAVVAAAQGRINLRNPGVLLLSPGTALAGFDEALIEAVKDCLQPLGRKNRGLMAVGPLVLRLQALPDPHAVQFGYGLFPIANRHYSGETLLQADR